MYFASRMQAGRMLASRLVPKYINEKCTVLALDDGGVIVGAQIAKQLHCTMNLLTTEDSSPAMYRDRTVISKTGAASKDQLVGQIVIIVSEGLKSNSKIDSVHEFLKPSKVGKLIFAVAQANESTVSRMHVLGDEIYCLDVLSDFFNKDHYYQDSLPTHGEIIQIIQNTK